jgi:hypothetical protein
VLVRWEISLQVEAKQGRERGRKKKNERAGEKKKKMKDREKK